MVQFADAFRTGDSDMFFALWTDYFSNDLDFMLQKLRIQCHVYFAVFPLLSTKMEHKVHDAMSVFKNFLEMHGHEFCGDQVCLQYYALPYIPNPRVHPSFKVIFTPQWRDELQDRLKLTLARLISKNDGAPRLLELISMNPVYYY